MTDDRELVGHCETCSDPIYEGDDAHYSEDVILCRDHAPRYRDILDSPALFQGPEGEQLTYADAWKIVDEYVSGGGNLNDPIVQVM